MPRSLAIRCYANWSASSVGIISTAVKHLLAAGITGDALVTAIAEMESNTAAAAEPVRDAAAERRREWDRDRRRKERAAAKSAVSTVSDGCPPDSADNADITPTPSPSFPPDPPNNPTPTPGNSPRTRKGTRLPSDWQPSPLDVATADLTKAWPPGTLDRETAKFRDFWAAKAGAGGVKIDWQATWRNWLRSADERIPRNGNATNRFGGPVPRTGSGFRNALNEATANLGRTDDRC